MNQKMSGFLHHLSISLLILLQDQDMAKSVSMKLISMKRVILSQVWRRLKHVAVLKGTLAKRKCVKGPQDHPKQTNTKTVDSGTNWKTSSDLKAKSHTPSIKNGMKFPKADKNEAKSLGTMTLDTATASVQGNAGNNQSLPSANDHYNSVLSANLADDALLKADLLQNNGRFSSPRNDGDCFLSHTTSAQVHIQSV